MNFQFSNLSDLEPLITTLLAESKCACHIINPHKTRILMWKEIKDGQTIYHLRIGIQKFISQEQLDRNGEIYWRYYLSEIKKESASKETEALTSSEPDPITKFHQRQAKTAEMNNHEQANEPAVNEPSN